MILRQHKLPHIRELKVNAEIWQARFPRQCSMAHCTAKCCNSGVWMDLTEQGNILQHAAHIQSHMDSSQERNPERWFDGFQLDQDFPSGKATGTAVSNGACVFLTADRRCVLQKASNEETGNLKPFFCFAFPLTLSEGELILDDARDPDCCTRESSGSLTVFDVCAWELEYVVGEDGVRELKAHAGLPPK